MAVSNHSIKLSGLTFSVDHVDGGVVRPVNKSSRAKITKLLDSKIESLQGSEKIQFKKSGAKCLKDNEWQVITLSKSERNAVKKILGAHKEIMLEHDVVSDLISTAAGRLHTPTSYYYSSGGGGHKSAKDARLESDWTHVLNAVKYEYEEAHPGCTDPRLKNFSTFIKFCKDEGYVTECDVLHDFLGRVGVMASGSWDRAQERGDINKLESLASKQWISDIVFGPKIFLSTLIHLIRHKPETLVSTQAMATPSILFAMKIYNLFYRPADKEEVKMHLYMTDMPTEYSSHFFNSLKGLYDWQGKEKVILHAPKPTDEETWVVRCGLPDDQVVELEIEELPVRPAFLAAAEDFRSNQSYSQVEIKLGSDVESALLQSVLSRQGSRLELPHADDSVGPRTFKYDVNPGDENYFLMLGSKPTKQAIVDYVDRFVKVAENNPQKNYNLFAFAGAFNSDPSKKSFYTELSAYILDSTEWPANLTVMPLSYQDPAQLVSLMVCCNTITRSGGGTIMEILVLEALMEKLGLPLKNRFIHTQSTDEQPSVVDGIGVWEKGNFFHLFESLTRGRVKAVTPSSLPFANDSEMA